MERALSIRGMRTEVGLTDGKYDEAQNCVSRETWDQIDAYYGHSRPNNCTK